MNRHLPAQPGSVLLVIGSALIGGAEKQLVRLAQELKFREIDVEVVFTEAAGPLTRDLDASNVPWKLFPVRVKRHFFSSIFGVTRFAFYLKRRGPNVVNSWLPESTFVAMTLSRIFSSQSTRIASVRGNPQNETKIIRFIMAALLRRVDGVLCNSSQLASMVEANYKVSREKIKVIPNGVDIPKHISDVRIEPPTAVVIANFHIYKGHHLLLEALSKVTAPLKVRLCGSGSERRNIEADVRARGLTSVIAFVTEPADISREIGSAQFAIHPSITEGMSNAILEEMAAGLPVVAFNIEGNSAVITDDVDGILVDLKNTDALPAAINKIASDADLRNRLSLQARTRMAQLTWESNVARYQMALKEIIDSSR